MLKLARVPRMPTKQFSSAIKAIEKLSYTELKRANQCVQNRMSQDEMGRIVAEREDSIDSCPYCRHEQLVKWGSSKQGKQRFKCKRCSKTFNALANTPLHKMKKPELMIAFGKLMNYAIPLRQSAEELGINLKTAFQWRHKMLSNPELDKPVELLGIVEADETFIPRSSKGSRKLARPARKRGGGKRPLVPVMIALDRNGAVTHTVMNRNTKLEIEGALAPVLVPNSILLTDGNLSYVEVVKNLPFVIEHKRLIADKGKKAKVIDGVYSIQRLNGYMARWKSFHERFRGVATHYLDRYASYFRFLDSNIPPEFWVSKASLSI